MATTASGTHELLDLFTRYNEDLWPLHVLAYGLGVAAIALLFAPRRDAANRAIAGLLAAVWLWLGVVFQGLYATDIDVLLGTLYGAMFVLEAALLFRHGVLERRLAFRARNGIAGVFGWLALAYAVVIYPVIGAVGGHGWPESPLLGMAPCPTTIATFGLLLLALPGVPRGLFVIPFLWAVLAPPAAMGHGIYEDAGLLATGVVAIVLVAMTGRRRSATAIPAATKVGSASTPPPMGSGEHLQAVASIRARLTELGVLSHVVGGVATRNDSNQVFAGYRDPTAVAPERPALSRQAKHHRRPGGPT